MLLSYHNLLGKYISCLISICDIGYPNSSSRQKVPDLLGDKLVDTLVYWAYYQTSVSNKNVGNSHKPRNFISIFDLFLWGRTRVASPLPLETRSTTEYNYFLAYSLYSILPVKVMVFSSIIGFKDITFTLMHAKLFEFRNSVPHTQPVIVKIQFQCGEESFC